MTALARVRVQAFKEAHELGLAWIACLVGMMVPALTDGSREIAVMSYGVGMAGLGALTIGHEFSYRTVATLLAQPASRGRLWVTKLSVLAVALVSLTIAFAIWPATLRRGAAYDWQFWLIILTPFFSGLFIAPWLTMICRSAVAGTIFTLPIPIQLAIVGHLLGFEREELFAAGVTLALSAVAAVMGWRTFVRLQARDGTPEIHLLQWRRSTTPPAAAVARRPGHVWSLVKKEVRLQQLTFVVAALYVMGWAAAVSASRVEPEVRGAFAAISVLYGFTLSTLAGSLASAEERRFGTLEWQTLQPVAAWRQWTIKVAVTIGVAALLAIVLPAVLLSLIPTAHGVVTVRREFFQGPPMLAMMALGVAGGLYVSSLSNSGLKALIVSLPVLLGLTALMQRITWQFELPFGRSALRDHRDTIAVTAVAMVALVAVRFALTNHRYADRPATRIAAQALGIALTVAVAMIVAQL